MTDLAGDYVITLQTFDGMEYSGTAIITVTAMESVGNNSGLFSTNFENGRGMWWADNGIWEVGEPTSGPNSAYSGVNVAATILDGNYIEDTDSRLISPSINLPDITGSEELHLSFFHWFAVTECSIYCSGTDHYEKDELKLQISEEITPGVWSDWQTLRTFDKVSGTWSNIRVDISGYATKKIKLGFLLNNSSISISSYGYCSSYDCTSIATGWYIDEILVEKVTL